MFFFDIFKCILGIHGFFWSKISVFGSIFDIFGHICLLCGPKLAFFSHFLLLLSVLLGIYGCFGPKLVFLGHCLTFIIFFYIT